MQVRLQFSTFLIFTYVLTWFGLGKRFPFELLGSHGMTIGVWSWGVVTLVWSWFAITLTWKDAFGPSGRLISSRKWKWSADRIAVLFGIACILIFCLDLIQWVHFKRFNYPFPLWLLIYDVILFFWVGSRISDRTGNPNLKVATVGALIHRLLATWTFPLITERSNMFSAIEQALQHLSQGTAVYGRMEHGGVGRIPYLPLTWLPFWPSYFLNTDPRWIGCVFFAVLGLLSDKLVPKSLNKARWLLAFWFLNPYLMFRHELYLDFFWLFCFLGTLFALQQRLILSAAVSGLSLATLQFAWIITPFWWLRNTFRKGWAKLFGVVIISAAVSSIFLLPFLIHDSKNFWTSTLFYLDLNNNSYAGELCLGFAPVFYKLGIQSLLTPLQIGIPFLLGCAALWIWITKRNQVQFKKTLLRLGGLAYFFFIIFSHFLENYFYLAPLLILSVAQSEDE